MRGRGICERSVLHSANAMLGTGSIHSSVLLFIPKELEGIQLALCAVKLHASVQRLSWPLGLSPVGGSSGRTLFAPTTNANCPGQEQHPGTATRHTEAKERCRAAVGGERDSCTRVARASSM